MIIIVGTPFDFRLGYGKRLSRQTVVQIDMVYATVGKNRDIALGLVGDVGAILGAVAQATSGRRDNGAAGPQGLDRVAARRGERGRRGARLPRLMNDTTPIHRSGWRTRSTSSSPRTRSSSATAATWSRSPAASFSRRGRDCGWTGSARDARRRHAVSRWRPSWPDPTKRGRALFGDGAFA